MTANDDILFPCPACGSQLAIPAELAGIVGPCPSCNTTIRAPYPAQPPVAAQPAPQPVYQAPVESQVPVYQTPPPAAGPAYPAHHYQPAAPPAYQTPPQAPAGYAAPPASAYPQPGTQALPDSPLVLKPEPRQLPSRSNHLEQMGKQIPDNRDPAIASAPYVRPQRNRKMPRILLGLAFILISGGVVGGVLLFLKKTKGDTPLTSAQRAETVRHILPEDHPSPAPAVEEVKPPAPVPDEPPAAGLTAIKVLDKFLSAKTLQERLPLIETTESEAELANTILAKPLPSVLRIETDFQDNNSIEKVTDVFYNVDFAKPDGTINPQTILVRTRGSAEPKVVAAPLLDLLGGRLADYLKTPSDKPGTFRVIVSAGAFCYDETVPNRDKKLTLKLLTRDNTKEISRAFFGKRSRLGEMLENDLSGFSYGQAKACTVILQWNRDEDPSKPYLEAIGLKSLDWNS